jgi:hypothetical protein
MKPTLDSYCHNRSKKNYYSVHCRLSGKISVFMLVPYREFISPVTTSILVLGLIRVEFFNVLIFFLNSCRWFVLFLVCIPYLVLVQVSGDIE